jgi:hypothetical protein
MTIEEKQLVPQKTGIVPFQEQCMNYCQGFEKVFTVTKIGSIKCDRETRDVATQWFNAFKPIILIGSSVDIADLAFEIPNGEQDVAVHARNKAKMMEYYAYAFVAYKRICQIFKRNAVSAIEKITEDLPVD